MTSRQAPGAADCRHRRKLRMRQKFCGWFIDSATGPARLRHCRGPIALVRFQRARADQVRVTGAWGRASRIPGSAYRPDLLDVPMLSITPEKRSGLFASEAFAISPTLEWKVRSFEPDPVRGWVRLTDSTSCRFAHPGWRGVRQPPARPCEQGGTQPGSDDCQKDELRTRGLIPFQSVHTLDFLSQSRGLKYREDGCGRRSAQP
jgi:hypothetical protein